MPSLPEVAPPFLWTDAPFGPTLECRALPLSFRHFFSTRHLDLSVIASWEAVARSMGVEPGRVQRLTQVHGAAVVAIRRRDGWQAGPIPEADALISDDPSMAIAVRGADCVPILLADTRTGAVGAVHAGWRGTAARVATSALGAMATEFGTVPGDVIAVIGPAIGACCYEVGPELVDAFASQGHERYLIDRWFLAPPPRRGEHARPKMRLDVAGSNRDQLILAGVPEHAVHACGLCTAMHLDVLTSFRAEREAAGRLVGVIRATPAVAG